MPRKRKKPDSEPTKTERRAAIDAARDALRKARPLDADVLLKLGRMGLVAGHGFKRYFDMGSELREFLALIQNSAFVTKAFPKPTDNMGPLFPEAPHVTFGPQYFAMILEAVERRINELKEISEKLLSDMKDPKFKRFARLWSQPEVSMAAWATIAPVLAGISKSVTPLRPADLMNLAMALGVDSPKETYDRRKWLWRSRLEIIQKAVDSLCAIGGPGFEFDAEQLEARFGHLRQAVSAILGWPVDSVPVQPVSTSPAVNEGETTRPPGPDPVRGE